MMSSIVPMRQPMIGADLYCDIQPVARAGWRALPPGLLIAILATLAAAFLSGRYGAPLTLMALLIGLSLNFLSADDRLAPGLAFASQHLLRVGIVLVGLRITLGQVVSLGPVALAAIAVIVALTIMTALTIGRWTGQHRAFSLIAGGGVAICGASAAMAIATTLGDQRQQRDRLALVLVGISALSAGAMVAYPILAHFLGLSDRQAGFVMGAAIHDVAQALGAGFSYSESAGHVAAIVKLTRVALLAPVLAMIAFFVPGHGGAARIGPPWFVIGFFVLAAVNSTGFIPAFATRMAEPLGNGLLAVAVTAVAIRSPLAHLLETGWKPLLVIGLATLVSLFLSLAAAGWLVAP